MSGKATAAPLASRVLEPLEPRLLLSAWYVDDLAAPLVEDGSETNPFNTIQEAIDIAVEGDEVVVLPGTYTGEGNRDISFLGKGITVRSQDGPEVTVVDAQGTAAEPHRGFIFNTGETEASILQGLTIRGGYADEGGGIVIYSSKPQILGCVIAANIAADRGGGIRIQQGCGVRILNSEITGNEAGQRGGGGVHAEASRLVFEDNVVSENVGWTRGGGGIHLLSCTAIVRRCVIGGNQSPGGPATNAGGGGIAAWLGNVSVFDSFFLGNYSGEDGGGMITMADGEIRGNVFVENHADNIGGGIDLHQTRQDFIDNLVLANTARSAGGVRIHGHEGVFSRNIVAGNWAQVGGGATQHNIAPTITNSVFVGNYASASPGGGIHLTQGLLAFCTVAGNASAAGPGGIGRGNLDSCQILDCIVWGNSGQQIGPGYDVRYSDVQGGYMGAGNIDADPLFLGGPSDHWIAGGAYDPGTFQTLLTGGNWIPGELVGKFVQPDVSYWQQFYIVDNDATSITVWGDASGVAQAGDSFQIYDYHLQEGSPAIDASRDAGFYRDLHGAPRPLDYPDVDNNGPLGEFDMGAYEAVPPGSVLAVDDRYSIEEDGVLAVGAAAGLLANDIGGPTTAMLVDDVAHGELVLSADGSFTYTPEANFNGTDGFSYQVGTNEATVTIRVNAFNDPPVASVTELTTDQDTPVQVDLRTLVSDLETPVEQLVFTVADAANGVVVLLADGHTAEFTPDPGYTGPASFTYAVTDTGDNGDCPITVGGVLIDVIVGFEPSTILGMVWEDFNNNGEVDFGEKAIEGVTLTLAGTDDRQNPVSLTAQTNEHGVYAFLDLRPGEYTLVETQPVGFEDGLDILGTVNGMPVGDNSVNDQISGIVLPELGSLGEDYNFAERPLAGSAVTAGQTATIGFWQNKNGQALIKSLNGEGSTHLGDWLAATFPNMYGADAGQNDLTGKDNAYVAAFYKELFRHNAKTSPDGPPKLDAQVLAVALATYVTNQTLAGTTAAAYGFLVSEHGVGIATFNVGCSGSAFGVDDNTEMTVLDMLLATDERTVDGVLYDNGDGLIDSLEAALRAMANEVYSAINEQGEI